MRILSFQVVKAHGYLTLQVDFFKQLTFLTGINGSGKTTVVRGVVAILTPSFRSLATMQYERMEVKIEHNGEEYRIWVARTENDFTIYTSSDLPPLQVPIYKRNDFEPIARFNEKQADFYREQHTLLTTQPILKLLKDLPTPLFLDLDRRGGEGIRRPSYIGPASAERLSRSTLTGTLSESLSEAQELADETYRTCLARRQEMTERLRKALILAAFSSSTHELTRVIPPTSTEEAKRLEKNHSIVVSTLLSLGISEMEIRNSVDPFFEELISLTSHISGMSFSDVALTFESENFNQISRWLSLRPQEKQIETIVSLVEKYNTDSITAFVPINRFLESINAFLGDSGKKLEFSKTGRLRVTIDKRQIGDIASLSSGERQLVIIMAHLAMNSRVRSGSVLIIDEPELSLHVRWQEIFVDAAMSASSDIQLILATHSPSIIMDRIESCVDLRAAQKQ